MKQADQQYKVYNLPIFQIWVDDNFNCRQFISRESIEDLTSSIKQDGLLFPVDVQPIAEVDNALAGFRYRLICGFRRIEAVKELGWESVPSRIREGLDDRQASLVNLTENLERKNLTVLEEALQIDKLFPLYRTTRSIAIELNRSETWVQVRRHLLLLSPWIQEAVASGRLIASDLKIIQHAIDPDDKAKQVLRAVKGGNRYKVLYAPKRRKKSEVKELITKLLTEGFNPNLLRILSWTVAEVDDEALEKSLIWLRDRKGWLK